MKMLYTTF